MSTNITVAENTLMSQQQQIETLIPKESFQKFKAFIASASMANDDLNQASLPSITKAFLDCAKSGLMPDGSEAAIVTRFDRKSNVHVATFQPMVKGAVRIINESPKIKSFHVKTVYEGDEFEVYSDEFGDHLKYKPSFEADRDDKNIKLFYASAVQENGSVVIEVMTRKQVEKHKESAKQTYVWDKWFAEMGIKTVIHRILKRLPVANPEIVTGLENSLNIDLSNNSESSVIGRPKANVFKNKGVRLEYLTGIVNGITDDEPSVVCELYLELDQEQQQNLWGDFSTKQKTYIREALASSYEQEPELIEEQK